MRFHHFFVFYGIFCEKSRVSVPQKAGEGRARGAAERKGGRSVTVIGRARPITVRAPGPATAGTRGPAVDGHPGPAAPATRPAAEAGPRPMGPKAVAAGAGRAR